MGLPATVDWPKTAVLQSHLNSNCPLGLPSAMKVPPLYIPQWHKSFSLVDPTQSSLSRMLIDKVIGFSGNPELYVWGHGDTAQALALWAELRFQISSIVRTQSEMAVGRAEPREEAIRALGTVSALSRATIHRIHGVVTAPLLSPTPGKGHLMRLLHGQWTTATP